MCAGAFNLIHLFTTHTRLLYMSWPWTLFEQYSSHMNTFEKNDFFTHVSLYLMTSVLHGFIWSKCVSNDRCNYSLCRSPIKRARFSLTSPDVSLELQIWHLQTIQKSLKGELSAILRRVSKNTEINHLSRKRVRPQEKIELSAQESLPLMTHSMRHD